MAKDKNIASSSVEDSPLQNQTPSPSDQVESTDQEGQIDNTNDVSTPAPVQIPQPTHWPSVQWYSAQYQWATGLIPPPYGTDPQLGESSQTTADHRPESIPGQGTEPHLVQHALMPYPFPFNSSSHPELGDPLYTSPADGPKLRLISQQLTGPANYHSWAWDLRRALVTKDKEGFIDGVVPYPTEERLQRHWRRYNQLVRT